MPTAKGSTPTAPVVEPTDPESAEAADIATADADGVADERGWIEADAVEVHQGAVARIDSTELKVTQGAIGAARADRIDVSFGAIGAAMGRDVTIRQGGATALLAQQATIDQALVQTVIAQQVEIRKPSFAIFVVAGRVTGEVKALFDWRGALAFGAAFAVITRFLGGGGRKRR